MRGQNNFFFLFLVLSLLFSLSAIADGTTGRTADGCTYKVINGQYLTSCPKKESSNVPAPAPVAHDQLRHASAAPITSYDSVPVRHNSAVSAPSLPPQQPNQLRYTAPVSSIESESTSQADINSRDEVRREHFKNKLLDQTYAGIQVGASNMKESNAGSSTGVGINIGTNIDETWGVEMGFSYAKQDLNLGLASRGSSTDTSQQSQGSPTIAAPSSDASLSSNLFTGEVQAHLTDPVKRLRPYVGGGLGWRSASLTENASTSSYGQGLAGGSLHQSSLGGLGTAGAKLRITKALNLGFAFRYFFPLARQDARLEQPASAYNAQTPSTSKLSAADDILTGSSQYQVLGGLQYSF